MPPINFYKNRILRGRGLIKACVYTPRVRTYVLKYSGQTNHGIQKVETCYPYGR